MMSLPRRVSFALLAVAFTLVLSAMPLAGQQNDPPKGTIERITVHGRALEGSRVLARYMRGRGFAFEYLEVDGNHGSMVPMVWPRIFEFFDRQGKTPPCAKEPC